MLFFPLGKDTNSFGYVCYRKSVRYERLHMYNIILDKIQARLEVSTSVGVVSSHRYLIRDKLHDVDFDDLLQQPGDCDFSTFLDHGQSLLQGILHANSFYDDINAFPIR